MECPGRLTSDVAVQHQHIADGCVLNRPIVNRARIRSAHYNQHTPDSLAPNSAVGVPESIGGKSFHGTVPNTLSDGECQATNAARDHKSLDPSRFFNRQFPVQLEGQRQLLPE